MIYSSDKYIFEWDYGFYCWYKFFGSPFIARLAFLYLLSNEISIPNHCGAAKLSASADVLNSTSVVIRPFNCQWYMSVSAVRLQPRGIKYLVFKMVSESDFFARLLYCFSFKGISYSSRDIWPEPLTVRIKLLPLFLIRITGSVDI